MSFVRDPKASLWIEGLRMIFPREVPSELSAFFKPEEAVDSGTRYWKEIAHSLHADMIGAFRSSLIALIPTDKEAKNSKTIDVNGLRLTQEALESIPIELPSDTKLQGRWKVRTIVGSSSGIFVYPFFEARISSSDKPGELKFEKQTGSQRRSGFLFRTQSRSELIFLGGKATDYEGSLVYSKLADSNADAPTESDTWGVLFFTAHDRALMVMDVYPTEGWEIYELRR